MKKRLLAVAAAAVLLVSQAAAVFAAPSITGNVALSGETSTAGYILTVAIQETEAFQTLEAEKPEVAELINQVNAGEVTMTEFAETIAEEYPEVSEQLADKEFLTGFFDLVPEDGVELNADGKYEVTLSVPALTENTAEVQVLHYSTVRGLWEVIEPSSIDLEAKTITVVFDDLSPVVVIAKEGTGAVAAGSQASGTSPKTGAGMEVAAWMGAAVVLFGMAAVVSVKKKYAK